MCPAVCVAALIMRLADLHRQGPSLSGGPGHHGHTAPVRTPSTVLVAAFIQICLQDGFSPQISSFRKTVSVLFIYRSNKYFLMNERKSSLVILPLNPGHTLTFQPSSLNLLSVGISKARPSGAQSLCSRLEGDAPVPPFRAFSWATLY